MVNADILAYPSFEDKVRLPRGLFFMGVRFIWKRPADGLHEGEKGGGLFQGFLVCERDAVVLAVDSFELVQGFGGEVHTLL